LCAALALAPAVACANAGTPLMLATAAQVLGGNLLIALLEAATARLFFKIPYWRGFAFFAFGNYASMCLGWVFVGPRDPDALLDGFLRGELSVDRIFRGFAWSIFLSWLATIAAEAPFCWAMPGKEKRTVRRALSISAVAQCVSYPLLVWYYLEASSFGLLTYPVVRPTADFAEGPLGWVYYADGEGGMRRVRTDGSMDEGVGASISPVPLKFFEFYPRWNTQGPCFDLCMSWDSMARPRRGLPPDEPIVKCAGDIAAWNSDVRSSAFDQIGGAGDVISVRVLAYGVADYRPRDAVKVSKWHASSIQPASGETTLLNTGSRVFMDIESPMLSARTKHISFLPRGQIVFELEGVNPLGRILLFDPATREIAVLARGNAPYPIFTRADWPEFREADVTASSAAEN